MWDERKKIASDWFCELRDSICSEFESIETEIGADTKFERTAWQRPITDKPNESGSILNGGGVMGVMRGKAFEKVGVNFSQVYGIFSEEFREKIPGAGKDGKFWACGVSLVSHMHSPLVPCAHMNTRMIVTSEGWFGGGGDLTPMFMDSPQTVQDKENWHAMWREMCDRHNPEYYKEHSAWADRYFYLPHRDEPRGVGGTFFDNLNSGDWEADFAYVKDTGLCFRDAYAAVIRRHLHESWTPEQREHQLERRGRYVEFNLIYDRGTIFGLKTGGNTEAILMSMPPEVKWP